MMRQEAGSHEQARRRSPVHSPVEGVTSEITLTMNSSSWITVGELGDAFRLGSNALPQAEGLAGTSIALYLESGSVTRCHFATATDLSWRDSAGNDVVTSYTATQIRAGCYFVDFVQDRQRAGTLTLLLDLPRRIFTAVIGELPPMARVLRPPLDLIAEGLELTGVTCSILSGAIETPFTSNTQRHLMTEELIGKRVEYTYSPTERYEHLYLNPSRYTWHCLRGSEKGLADTDLCDYRKLDDNLYLFVWREKIIPTLGVIVVDLDQLKTTGKILGYRDFTFREITNFQVGAHARIVHDEQA